MVAPILERLKKGPASTGEIARAVKTWPVRARRTLKALADKRLVHSTGTRVSQQWHLGVAGTKQPGKPAKEAP
jgi:predicted ArsR family transcriptional regulator